MSGIKFFFNSRLVAFGAVLVTSASLMTLMAVKNADEDIERANRYMLQEAQMHYANIVTTRGWASHYGGVFVRPVDGLVPNPYLKEMIDEASIETKSGETLIKINPAWMTRQLSEMTQSKEFSYRITSDHPVNPSNIADSFEREALEYLRTHPAQKVYYRFDGNGKKLRYLGGLYIEASCLQCHDRSQYAVGDLRGGISMTLSTEEMEAFNLSTLRKRDFLLWLIWTIHLLLGGFYWVQERQKNRMTRINQILEEKVKARTRELKMKNSYLKTIFNLEQDIIFTMDRSWKLIDYNRACGEFFGVEYIEKLRQKGGRLYDRFEPYDNGDPDFFSLRGEELIEYMVQDPDRRRTILVRLRGNEHIFELMVKEIEHSSKRHILVIMSDITRRQQQIETLEEAALTDTLTGIGNRLKFDVHFNQYYKTSQRYKKEFSLILMDIDFFKRINDTFGHDQGDKVLVSLSGIVQKRIRRSDILCRWGGEEFVVLLPMTTLDEANRLAETIKEAIATEHFETVSHVTCSFGVASYRKGDTKEQLFKRLDEALYRAKKSGKNCVVSV